MLHYLILHYTTLYCAILYFTLLCYTTKYYTMLYCSVLCHAMLYPPWVLSVGFIELLVSKFYCH